jgi:PKD repeat protein
MFRTQRSALIGVLALLSGACTIKETPAPPLTGPSEYALSITVTASPDLLTRNGASRSDVTVTARNWRGEPVTGLQIRLDMVVDGQVQDFGSLSTRTLFTGGDGRAVATYTAPPAPPTGASAITDRVAILASSVGTNAQDVKAQAAEIRLVLPFVNVPGAPMAFFNFAPTTGITTATSVIFNASGSYPVAGSRIVNYAWDWGDGTTDFFNAGPNEDHDWAGPGTYAVTLTVTDDLGLSASTTRMITVGG